MMTCRFKTASGSSHGFRPINLHAWVRLFLKSNPGEKADKVTARLQRALKDYHEGARCHCGEPIWVIGSAEAGNACFPCIPREAAPSEDYEIGQALEKTPFVRATKAGRKNPIQ